MPSSRWYSVWSSSYLGINRVCLLTFRPGKPSIKHDFSYVHWQLVICANMTSYGRQVDRMIETILLLASRLHLPPLEWYFTIIRDILQYSAVRYGFLISSFCIFICILSKQYQTRKSCHFSSILLIYTRIMVETHTTKHTHLNINWLELLLVFNIIPKDRIIY